MRWAYHVVGYLVKTSHLSITYRGQLRTPYGLTSPPPGFVESMGLHTYTDSSWSSEVHPFGGHVVMLCNGAVQWSAKKVKVVSDSTVEAETVVASRNAKDTVSVRLVLEDMGARVHGRAHGPFH